MTKRQELNKLITYLNAKLLYVCLYGNEDFSGYRDLDFELYFKDFFYIPLLFLQYERPSLLFSFNNDRYRTDIINNLDEYKNLYNFIKDKYNTKEDLLTTILINYSKFIIYYIINLIKKFENWKTTSVDILYNLVKDQVHENENFENDEIKIIAIKRYIESLMFIAIVPEFTKILVNDIIKKEVKLVLRYDIDNLEVDSSFSVNSSFSIVNSNEIPHKNAGLIQLIKQKENGVIELSINTPYSYKADSANNRAFVSFINRTFHAYKYQEISFNALLLLIPSSLKIKKEIFYLKTFQTLVSSNITSSEIYFLSRFQDINKDENVKICKKDKNKLLKLSKLLEPISDYTIKHNNYRFIIIALKFFKDAMSKDNKSERMSYCVQALEAIYNTNGSQITRTISQRLAIVFALLKDVKPKKFVNINPMIIQKQIIKAYEIRSKYVHGAINSKVKDDLLNAVIYYTQISIIISLAILSLQKINISKDKLNEDFDSCLISKRFYGIYKNLFMSIKEYL